MAKSEAKKIRQKKVREGKRNVGKDRSIYSATKDGQNFMRERKMPTKNELMAKQKHKQIDIEID